LKTIKKIVENHFFVDFFSAPVDNNRKQLASNYLAAYPPPLDEPLRYLPAPPTAAQYELYQRQAGSPHTNSGEGKFYIIYTLFYDIFSELNRVLLMPIKALAPTKAWLRFYNYD
jgi:hypothetical protein